jgi:beta-catenin-like protein 1
LWFPIRIRECDKTDGPLHKVPKLPAGGNKRKMPDNPTPEMLKKMRADTSLMPSPSPSAVLSPNDGAIQPSQKSRKATVQDAGDEDQDMEQDFAPGGDADYFVEEDDEGRFFGGGLTSEQKDILNIFDNAGGEGTLGDVRVSWREVDLIFTEVSGCQLEELSITGIRRLLLRFERAVNKNQDQRSKHPDDPSK